MLKLGSLGQKIGQLLAVLHDNGRLFPHRRRVSRRWPSPKERTSKRHRGGRAERPLTPGRHPQRACRADHPLRPHGMRTRRPGARQADCTRGRLPMLCDPHPAGDDGDCCRRPWAAGEGGRPRWSGQVRLAPVPLRAAFSPAGPWNPAQPARTCPPHQHEDSLSSSCRRQQLPWTQMRQLCVGGRCRAATRPSDHNGGSSRDCY